MDFISLGRWISSCTMIPTTRKNSKYGYGINPHSYKGGRCNHRYADTGKKRQLNSYHDCIKRFGRPNGAHRWIALFDPDEFLVLKKHDSVVDFLSQTSPEGFCIDQLGCVRYGKPDVVFVHAGNAKIPIPHGRSGFPCQDNRQY